MNFTWVIASSSRRVTYQTRGSSAKIMKWHPFSWLSHKCPTPGFQETLPFPKLGSTSETFLVAGICFGTGHLQV